MEKNDQSFNKFISDCDQFAMQIKPLASLLFSHFSSLQEAGFDTEQSLRLAMGLQHTIFSKKPDGSTESGE